MLTSLYVLRSAFSRWPEFNFLESKYKRSSPTSPGMWVRVVSSSWRSCYAPTPIRPRARARTHARPHVGMRVCVSRIGCFFRCIVSYSVHVSRALYEGQFRGHKQGSLTDDKRHLGSWRIRQDEAVVTVELLDALFLAGERIALGTWCVLCVGQKIFRLFKKTIKSISFKRALL